MDLNTLREYLKIHLISLEQDKEDIEKSSLGDDSVDWHYIQGQIDMTNHILGVINER
jgi:riboflavin synthase alpha subunit